MDIKEFALVSKPVDFQISEYASVKRKTEGNPSNLNMRIPILKICPLGTHV